MLQSHMSDKIASPADFSGSSLSFSDAIGGREEKVDQ
jgi:hypothetical protein